MSFRVLLLSPTVLLVKWPRPPQSQFAPILLRSQTSDANQTLSIGEKLGDRTDIIQARITETKTALVKEIRDFGKVILEQPVDETQVGYSYSDHVNSGPYVLKGGHFANEFQPGLHVNFGQSLQGTLLSGAIAWIWREEQVYIVKNSYPIDGTANNDANLDADLSNRTCDNNGTCYTYLKNTGMGNYAAQAFQSVPGFDKLSQFGIDPLQYAQAAVAAQSAGGYFANFTIPQALPFFKNYKPPRNMFNNLLVCSLDFFHDSWKNDYGGSDPSREGWDYNVSVPYLIIFLDDGQLTRCVGIFPILCLHVLPQIDGQWQALAFTRPYDLF